jgi:hypothetical protein
MNGASVNLNLYADSVIRQEPIDTTWCQSHEDIWNAIEPYKENCYIGTMTLNEIFLYCSSKGDKSNSFNNWWQRKTLNKHVYRFFKKESKIDFNNVLNIVENKNRFLKLASIVQLLNDLPIRNQISVLQTDKVMEVHPGGTRLTLKDFYLDPVPVFLYSYDSVDFLEPANKNNITLLNSKSSVNVYEQNVLTVTPPTESYGVMRFEEYSGMEYTKSENEITVDGKLYFIKKEGEWIINPQL